MKRLQAMFTAQGMPLTSRSFDDGYRQTFAFEKHAIVRCCEIIIYCDHINCWSCDHPDHCLMDLVLSLATDK